MTRNYLRVPCMCHRCGGAERDYRTLKKHAEKDAANRPLFPLEEAKDNHIDQPMQEHAQPIPPPPDIDEPYHEAALEDIVSYAETLPNCHEPVYNTVRSALFVC
jgi:hypothetical protein